MENKYKPLMDFLGLKQEEDEQRFTSMEQPKDQQMFTSAGETGFDYPEQVDEVNDIVEAENAPQDEDPSLNQIPEKKPLDYNQQLLNQLKEMQQKRKDEVERARGIDSKMNLLNQLNQSFAGMNKALASGYANVDPKAVDFKFDSQADQVEKDYDRDLDAMMKEYKLLASKDKDKLSERDKLYLDYYRDKLDLDKQRLGQQDTREGRISRKQQLDAARGLIKDDPRTKKAFEQAMALEDIQPLVEQVKAGNQNAAAALGTRLARAMGEVGVLTDADVTRYVQGTSWGRKLQDWYSRGAEGAPSPETLEEIVKNADTISGKLQSNLDNVYSNASSRMKTAYPDLDNKTISGLLGRPNLETAPSKVRVKLPNGKMGRIDADKVDAFMQKYPDAEIME